jgi:large subunit ribosomal protein L31
MQKEKHPPYQEVLFEDSSTGHRYVIKSTLNPKERSVHEGKEYPYCKVSTSSYSHPLYAGKNQIIDAEGRVEKFRNKYKKNG